MVVLSVIALSGCETAVRHGDFRVRDPFVLAEDGTYWLYESVPWNGGSGVVVRTSQDLMVWTSPREVAEVPPEVGCTAVWAPEVHKFEGSYWLFATITEERGVSPIMAMGPGARESLLRPRGTWIFKANSPEGPFLPVRRGPIPPRERMTLDGTLYVEDGVPYMVYCHEWCQTGDGMIEYAPLKSDFTGFESEPKRLLRASEAIPGAGKITDGPYFYRSKKSAALFMIWSNTVDGHGYSVLVRRSKVGRIAGPWSEDTILFGGNGGHGMVFTTFDGKSLLAIHQPNESPNERLRLFELEDDGFSLRIKDEAPTAASR